eukprot:UN31735
MDQAMCSGFYQELNVADSGNGRMRPPAASPCVGDCIVGIGRWGTSWCYTEPEGTPNRQWGSDCIPCDCAATNLNGTWENGSEYFLVEQTECTGTVDGLRMDIQIVGGGTEVRLNDYVTPNGTKHNDV